jgi:Glycosyl hydrolase family 57/Alpha-amylase/4-alpha-glucanotransferase, middle domain/Alpha-amylase/4-alpha-glucanotransferase, C-terminal
MPAIRFCFGLHLHQPVGNFDHVIAQHVRDVYRPFLERIRAHEFVPVALHISGPLLDWFERRDHQFLDLLGDLTADGKLEWLLAGYEEPVLAALPREDRVEQIAWMREALRARFGAAATGLWLTERVWEPDLAADLHDAGVRFALVDDRHFVVTGFQRDQLHAPYWTEHGGKRLALFPIDERLRYLIPFEAVEETGNYLRRLREAGHRLAVLADDGEKFGGWPGTKEWVYDRGWLDQFLAAMREHVSNGDVVLSTFAEALDAVPSGGIAYLPTASYREMETWSLPTTQAQRLTALEQQLGAERMAGPDGALVRGAHWKNFFVKYSEANRMHKKMLALSALCRERGNPATARRAIGRAQCNDAYWHGVFGGLYLPFLRAAVWRNLAEAERLLRVGEPLRAEETDIDGDGHAEVWIHSAHFSAIVSPYRGGAIEELTRFSVAPEVVRSATERTREVAASAGVDGREDAPGAAGGSPVGANHADVLTRRREAYHVLSEHGYEASTNTEPSVVGGAATPDASLPAAGTPSIHELEHGFRLRELPAVDLDDRAIFIERVIPASVTQDQFARAQYQPVTSAARIAMTCRLRQSESRVEVALEAPDGRLRKTLTFLPDGRVRAEFEWDGRVFGESDCFTVELSLDRALPVACTPSAELWEYPIETVSKSEKGLDRVRQGVALVVRWPAVQGRGSVDVG